MKINDRVLSLKKVKASTLEPHPKNWRTHTDAQRGALRAVLAEVGFADAVLTRQLPDGRLQIIDGHLRAEELGDDVIPVLVLDVTEAEADKLLATMDPLAAMAGTDAERLSTLLLDTRLDSPTDDFRQLVSFIAKRHGAELPEETPVNDPDSIPEPPAKPITQPGDLWILGEHRLLCGDATKADDVARVMAGERAVLMNTDPPYGIAYANDERPNPGVAKPRVAKDELHDQKLQAFLEAAFSAAKAHALTDRAAWYLWHAHLTQGFFAAAAAAAAANVVLHRQIIWVKPVLLLGRGHYHWKHEPCFMGWVKGKEPPDYGEGNGERTQTTIWEIESIAAADRKEFNHSTPKPTRLFTIPLVKHTRSGEICFEPFAGTGPQVIAAEQLGRRCFAIEIEPKYCDVIVKRWEAFTGNQATRANTKPQRAQRTQRKKQGKVKRARKKT